MAVPGRTVPAVVASGQDGDRLARVDHADLDLLAGEPRRRLRKTASARGSLAVAGIAHRNLVIIVRLAEATSITAAVRYHARRPGRPLRTIMKC
jgi:hypothetical protein